MKLKLAAATAALTVGVFCLNCPTTTWIRLQSLPSCYHVLNRINRIFNAAGEARGTAVKVAPDAANGATVWFSHATGG